MLHRIHYIGETDFKSSLYLPNGEHDEVDVGEVVSQPEVAPLPLGDGGLVEVGEGQLVPQVANQLGPGREGGVSKFG